MIIHDDINGIELELETGDYYFSRSGVDLGTRLMLQTVVGEDSRLQVSTDKVLDLGCGYGVVGVYLGKCYGGDHVTMTDIEADAIELSKANLERNGITGARVQRSDGLRDILDKDYSLILSNPPYHTDFSVAKEFIEDGYKALRLGGMMVMVTKRRTWYENKLKGVFGGVKVFEQGDYFVFVSEKRVRKAVNVEKGPGMSKKLARKMQARKHIK